jgi:hypothetical protein
MCKLAFYPVGCATAAPSPQFNRSWNQVFHFLTRYSLGSLLIQSDDLVARSPYPVGTLNRSRRWSLDNRNGFTEWPLGLSPTGDERRNNTAHWGQRAPLPFG